MTPIHQRLAADFQSILGSEPAIAWSSSPKGAATGWCTITDPALLVPLAQCVAAAAGRLSALTGYLCAARNDRAAREIAYHFDLEGATLTVTVELPLEGASVPSLTSIFRSADWSERELMELYDVKVLGHPDPRRLFLDDSLDPALLERLVPYSSFINAASSKTLWERVMGQEKESAA